MAHAKLRLAPSAHLWCLLWIVFLAAVGRGIKCWNSCFSFNLYSFVLLRFFTAGPYVGTRLKSHACRKQDRKCRRGARRNRARCDLHLRLRSQRSTYFTIYACLATDAFQVRSLLDRGCKGTCLWLAAGCFCCRLSLLTFLVQCVL